MEGSVSRRGFLKCVCGVGGLGGVPGVAESAGRTVTYGDWPQYGHDQRNTGSPPDETGPEEPVGERWTEKIVPGRQWDYDGSVVSSPVVAEDTVYVGSTDGKLYAMDAADGGKQWHYQTEADVRSTPAVGDVAAFVGSDDGRVHSVWTGDGSRRWIVETGGPVRSSPTLVDDTVLVGTDAAAVLALARDDGSERWRTRTAGTVRSAPAAASGLVLVGDDAGYVYALDGGDGRVVWRSDVDGPVSASLSVAVGSVFVATEHGTVYALDLDDGQQKWSVQAERAIEGAPAVAGETLYVANRDGRVLALSATDGSVEWEAGVGDVWDQPAVVDGVVYLGTNGLTALDASDGTKRWFQGTGPKGPVHSSPTVVDGTVFYSTYGGEVTALEHSPPPTPTPTFAVIQSETPPPTTSLPGEAGSPTDASPGTSTSTGGSGVPMFAVGLGALLTAGGTYAWWRRSGDRTGRADAPDEATPSDETPASGAGAPAAEGISPPDEPTEGTEPAPAVADALDDAGEALDAVAAGLESEPVLALREHLDRAEEALAAVPADEEALGMELARRRDELAADHETLAADVETVADYRAAVEDARGRLDGADAAREDGDLEGAIETFQTLEEELDELAARLEAAGFYGLLETVERLEASCRDGREAAERRRGPGPPIEVPGAPAASVAYDDLEEDRVIGKGGNADVVLMRAPDGAELAVKKPRFAGTMQRETVERFLAEAETWERLDDHPHVADIVDYGSDPLPWIAMEYMDGGGLDDRVGTIEFREAVWIALQVTDAVLHAHRRGVAHLDLKPANILFRETSGDDWDVPKVADWGLAKLLLEHSKSIEGLTPQYAAPEQVSDAFGSADQQTDIYQLGAVIYELFVGEPPFTGEPFAVVRKITDERVVPPTEAEPSLPEAVDDVLLPALAREKADRYEDVLYLRDALRELHRDV